MKLYVALVLVVTILVFAGSTLGNSEGDLSQPRSCSIAIDEGEPRELQNMLSQMYKMGINCLDETGTSLSYLLYSQTSEERLDFFKNFCQKQPQIRECLANVTLTSRACQNESRHQLFQVFRELLENTLDSGCVQDGEVLANMVTAYKHNTTVSSNLNQLQNCLINFVGEVHLSTSLEVSDFSRMYIFYRKVVQAKECINHQMEADQNIAGDIVTLLSEISEKLECFHPHDDSVILCKNLDPNSVGSPMACPIKSKDELNAPLYDILLKSLPACVWASIQYDPTHVHITGSLEQSRSYSKYLCQRNRIAQRCLSEVGHLSSACLDTNHHLKLTTVEDFIKNLLDHLCMDDGRHIADVMFKVRSNVAKSSEPDFLSECASVAHPSAGAIDTNFTSAKTLEYYNEFKVFKKCLTNKLKGDADTLASAEMIVNGVLNNMKCINHDEINAVLCETIDNDA